MSKVNSIAKFPRGLIWRTASSFSGYLLVLDVCKKGNVQSLERSFRSALNILFQLTLLRGALAINFPQLGHLLKVKTKYSHQRKIRGFHYCLSNYSHLLLINFIFTLYYSYAKPERYFLLHPAFDKSSVSWIYSDNFKITAENNINSITSQPRNKTPLPMRSH